MWIQKQPIFVYLNPMFSEHVAGHSAGGEPVMPILGLHDGHVCKDVKKCSFSRYPPIKDNLMEFSLPLKWDEKQKNEKHSIILRKVLQALEENVRGSFAF